VDIQDVVSIDQERGVVTVFLPAAFAIVRGSFGERVRADWPNVTDQMHDDATQEIIEIVQKSNPSANSFRFVGPKRRGGEAAAAGGAGGTDPDVVVQ